MVVREVIRLPNPILTNKSDPVTDFDLIAQLLADDLVDTMRVSPACVGLAAPQIGVGLRAFSMDLTGHPKAKVNHGLVVMFNPELLWSQDPKLGREGCMSVPDLTGDVSRARRLAVRGYDVAGNEIVIEAQGFEARCVLHEMDHLDGLVFLDRAGGPTAIYRRQVYK